MRGIARGARGFVGWWGWVALLVWCASPSAVLAGDGLVFGVFPYLSPRHMSDQFAPLRTYLEGALGQPVTLRSAPDYKRFIERTNAGEYDFIFNAPQLARLAQKTRGFAPLAQTGSRIQIIAVTRKDSPVRTLADLRGRQISIGARTSLTHQVLREELGKVGLTLDKDVRYLDTAYFSNVLHAVIRGDAVAGATATSLWEAAPAEERAALRIFFTQPGSNPGFILVAHPRLGVPFTAKLRHALLGFKDTAEGRAFFASSKLMDFRPVDEATMRGLDPYTHVYGQD